MKRYFFRIILSVISILMITLIVLGQNNNNQKNDKKQLIDRFERVVKNKEPKFKGSIGAVWERNNRFDYSMGWKFGEAYVSGEVNDFDLENEAIEYIRVNYKENPPIAIQVAVKLTNLGDEAWMNVDKNRKDGNTQILIRKGSVVMVIKATSSTMARRFAKYFVREIEKRGRDEP